MKTLFIICIYLSLLLITSCGSSGSDPFAETTVSKAKVISIEEAFKIIAHENEKTRTLYTKKVVGLGKKKGINFHEDWQKEDVEAGPLPALFLRGTSNEIQKTDIPLGLYLGSDFPIVKANKFVGLQAEKFKKIRETGEPEFFFDEENQLYTAMFPDVAQAQPCISCHNSHDNTSKTDWIMGDIMGATTWTYPSDSLTLNEMLELVKVYRMGVEKTYNTFLAELKNFKKQDIPEIGEKWSDEAYAVPSTETFLEAINEETAGGTLKEILKYIKEI